MKTSLWKTKVSNSARQAWSEAQVAWGRRAALRRIAQGLGILVLLGATLLWWARKENRLR